MILIFNTFVQAAFVLFLQYKKKDMKCVSVNYGLLWGMDDGT